MVCLHLERLLAGEGVARVDDVRLDVVLRGGVGFPHVLLLEQLQVARDGSGDLDIMKTRERGFRIYLMDNLNLK